MKEIINRIYDNISPEFQMLLFLDTLEKVYFTIMEDIIDDEDFKLENIRQEFHFDTRQTLFQLNAKPKKETISPLNSQDIFC